MHANNKGAVGSEREPHGVHGEETYRRTEAKDVRIPRMATLVMQSAWEREVDRRARPDDPLRLCSIYANRRRMLESRVSKLTYATGAS